jgi:hypothetical protein
MTKLLTVCCIAVFAGFAIQTSAQEKQALRMVRTIPLPQFNRFYVASQAIGDQEAAILVFEPVP